MPVGYRRAIDLHWYERDRELEINADVWPSAGLRGWTREEDHYWREITRKPQEGDDALREAARPSDDDDLGVDRLWEGMFRFPSAPVHGLHRMPRAQYGIEDSENFHTLRVLAHARPTRPPLRIYLLQNGLNEFDKLGLYYQLAARLLQEDKQAVCIVRPFPGHLARFPFERYAEKPLDRYLADGSHLFRQFMRYMIETQWLLSLLVTRSEYWCPSGALLLAGGRRKDASRLDDGVLAGAITKEWLAQHEASAEALRRRRDMSGDRSASQSEPLSQESVLRAIKALRGALQWDKYPKRAYGRPRPSRLDPSIHVVGYSLGGFTAQSIMMAWPFAVASCSTLLAGGALRELAPTAFAHPEEWQTVLHSLRYELDNLMTQRFLEETPAVGKEDYGRVAGVRSDLFLYLQRVFYEIFEQEYRGSYQTRVSEFGRRMLFVVGGNDPIVRAQSVLDSAPADGVNLIEIARLGHFLGTPTRDAAEAAQRRFWVPEVARFVARFAKNAVRYQIDELADCWVAPGGRQGPTVVGGDPDSLTKLTEDERVSIPHDGSLPNPLFERVLDDLVWKIQNQSGYLFILRNEVPSALLPDEAVRRIGLYVHHDNQQVMEYTAGVIKRREALLAAAARVVIVVPEQADVLARSMDARHGLPSQAETPIGQLPRQMKPQDVWRFVTFQAQRFNDTKRGSVRSFVAGGVRKEDCRRESEAKLYTAARKEAKMKDGRPLMVTALPDCWIWISDEVLGTGDGDQSVQSRLDAFYRQATSVADGDRRFRSDLAANQIRIVAVSRARFNPRFRGRLVLNPRPAADLFVHAALCLKASTEGVALSDGATGAPAGIAVGSTP